MPQVSVIIAVLNGEQTIRKAIESAQRQTVHDIEIVVVDDGSTDGTHAVVMTMAAEDARIKLLRLPQNIGVGGARNAALAVASGDWITILDADDWYSPERLDVLLKAAQDLRADLVADNLEIYDHIQDMIVDRTCHGRPDRVTQLTAEIFFTQDNPLRRHPMGFLQPLIRRQFLVDHKIMYDPSHRVGEDFIFVSEILLSKARAFIIPGAYYVYVHRISPTTRKISPHSHSKVKAVFSLMVQGCDELLQKYGATMAPETRRALLQRRRIFESAVCYKEMRRSVRQGQVMTAVKLTATHPLILVLIGNIITGLVIANLKAGLRFLSSGRGRRDAA